MITYTMHFRLIAILALLAGSGNSYSADGCNSTCRRDLEVLREAVKSVNDQLSKPIDADIDKAGMAYRYAAIALSNAVSRSRSERFDLFYATWEEYLNAQANCLAAQAEPLRYWESIGGWAGMAESALTGNVVRLIEQTAVGVKNNDAILKQCKSSRDALNALRGMDVNPHLAGVVFTIDVNPVTPVLYREVAIQFRLVTPKGT